MQNDDRAPIRVRLLAQGVVQGVGFRPSVYRLAQTHGLVGWVRNRPDGVEIQAQGPRAGIDRFVQALPSSCPPGASLRHLDVSEIPIAVDDTFAIVESTVGVGTAPTVPADSATCGACAAEIDNPAERRYGYPFTNCTHCGPRYSIVLELPYDRTRTTMSPFAMCPDCRSEYDNPLDRRFHAQPIACPRCGPRLTLLCASGASLADGANALQRAAEQVLEGEILALKGIGGFQLVADATAARAVRELRRRKHREAKPFAVMFPSVEAAQVACEIGSDEQRALLSREAPIVLVRRRRDSALCSVCDEVAPNNPWLGAMLPYSPLHRLLLRAIGRPVVCTSGNLSEEPMCIDDSDALRRLGGVADLFLVHDRAIARPIDDSIVRLGPCGNELLRRARGYAPVPIPLPGDVRGAGSILAVGGHLKGTVAVSVDDQAVVSQHLGDLGTAESAALLERTVADLLQFYRVSPRTIACDLHPDYTSTRLAERLAQGFGCSLVRVQHHHAHIAACVAEHDLRGEVLGLAWDGTGFGLDATIWGGEALLCDGAQWCRFAHIRTFPLVGGERAVREPRRSALGLLHALGHSVDRAAPWFDASEFSLLRTAIGHAAHTPRTSSMGRLFDAVSALVGLRCRSDFEGQAAMDLEFAAQQAPSETVGYPFPIVSIGSGLVADTGPLVTALLEDLDRGLPVPVVSARFHHSLADLACAIAERAAVPRVALSGGCFQNLLLATAVRRKLTNAGFDVRTPATIPCNDGGISFGQLVVAARTTHGRG